MPVIIDNWGPLTAALDQLGADFANFVVDRECCMANAYAGLNPETGEDLIDVGGTQDTDDDGNPTTPTTTPEVPCDKFGNPLQDVSGNPVEPPEFNPAEGMKKTYVRHLTDFGNEIWCVPGFLWALAVPPGTTPDETADYSFLNDDPPTNGAQTAEVGGAPFACPTDWDVPEEFVGCPLYPYTVHCFDAVEPDPTQDPSNTDCDGFTGNAHSAYYKMWQEYLCCYKKNQNWYQYVYWGQVALSLGALYEGIQCYNDILDHSKDYAEDLADNASQLRGCIVEMLGDGTEENPGALKDCQNQLLQGHVERIGTINEQNTFVCMAGENMWDCYVNTFQPLEKQYATDYASKLFSLVCTGQDSADALSENASMINNIIEAAIQPKLSELFPEILCSVSCPANNLNEWRQRVFEKAYRLDAHYKNTYECGEKTMIPAVMNMSECLVRRLCEAQCRLMECAKHDEDTYNTSYRSQEGHFANQWLAKSAHGAAAMHETLCWLDTNVPAMMMLFNCIEKGFSPIQDRMFQNANELAPEVVCCYKEFRENATEYKGQWSKIYKDGEFGFVSDMWEVAQQLVKGYTGLVKRVSDNAQEDREHFDRYRRIEAEATPDIVNNGWLADMHSLPFAEWWQGKSKEFCDLWRDHWMDCELQEKAKWVELWDKTNPITRTIDNAQLMQDFGRENLEIIRRGLKLTEEEMFKACEDPEYFEYCIETSAVAYAKRTSSFEQENIIRCGSRYAPGQTEELRIRAMSAFTKQEAAVVALTERWKWQANRFLEDRQYNRKIGMLGLVNGLSQVGIGATQASSSDFDRLLQRQREVYSLGQQWLNQSKDAGNIAFSQYGRHTQQMLSMLGIWQVYPQLALSGNAQAIDATRAVIQDTTALIGRGQEWTQIASGEKSKATDIIDTSMGLSVQLAQLAQFYAQQAQSSATQRGSLAVSAGQVGNATVQLGHELHNMGAAKLEGVMARSIEGAGLGIRAAEVGHALEATALDAESKMTLNALRHLELGVTTLATALNYIEESTQTYQQSYQLSNSASTNMLNLFKHSQNAFALSTAAHERCYKQEFEMLCKAKDYAQKNYELHQNALTRGTTGNVLGDLLSDLQQNVSGAFAGLGNGVENLISLNNPTPPLPNGQGTFGTTGTGGFGGLPGLT